MLSWLKELLRPVDRPMPTFEPAQEPARKTLEDLRAELIEAEMAFAERVGAAAAKLKAETPAGRIRAVPEGGYVIERSHVDDGRLEKRWLYEPFGYKLSAESLKHRIKTESARQPHPYVVWTTYQKVVGSAPTARASASRWGYSDASVGSKPIYEPVVFETKVKAQKALEIWLNEEAFTTYTEAKK